MLGDGGLRGIEVQIGGLRRGEPLLHTVQSCVDDEGKGQIGVHGGVGRPQLHPPVLALGRGDADELGPVLVGPGHIPGGLLFTQAAIGGLTGV